MSNTKKRTRTFNRTLGQHMPRAMRNGDMLKRAEREPLEEHRFELTDEGRRALAEAKGEE